MTPKTHKQWLAYERREAIKEMERRQYGVPLSKMPKVKRKKP